MNPDDAIGLACETLNVAELPDATPDGPQPASISASYEVLGGTVQDVGLYDITEMSIQDIADAVDASAPGISLCHECGHQISDPELGEITAMSINGVDYERVDGVWRKAKDA